MLSKPTKIICAVVLAVASGSAIGYKTFSKDQAHAAESITVKTAGQAIRDKMLNAIDYYRYAAGSFTSIDLAGSITHTDFEVQEGDAPVSKVTVTNEAGRELFTSISNNDEIVTKNENSKTFTKQKKLKWAMPAVGDRKQKHPDGNNAYIYRNDPAAPGAAHNVTFPQEVAFWLDDEEANYTVTGHEMILGRDATIITGTMLKSMRSKAESFILHVDTETGILLRLDTKRSDGTPSMSMKVENIAIDANSHDLKFNIDAPAGYQETKQEDLKAIVNQQQQK